MDDLLFETIDVFPLTDYERGILECDNMKYVGDVLRKTRDEMLRAPRWGRSKQDKLTKWVESHGLSFGLDLGSEAWCKALAEREQ
jgi:DNA-directed RNA polymerase alpha subunit